jgi:hypothetical protein
MNPEAAPVPAATIPATPDGATVSSPGFETATAEEEGRFHNYVGYEIPWYVRVGWLLFWVFSAWYVIRLLLPALDAELLSPP